MMVYQSSNLRMDQIIAVWPFKVIWWETKWMVWDGELMALREKIELVSEGSDK